LKHNRIIAKPLEVTANICIGIIPLALSYFYSDVIKMSNVSTYGTDLQDLIREDFRLIVTAKELR